MVAAQRLREFPVERKAQSRQRVLRACITSQRTGPDDVAVLVEELESARSTVV